MIFPDVQDEFIYARESSMQKNDENSVNSYESSGSQKRRAKSLPERLTVHWPMFSSEKEQSPRSKQLFFSDNTEGNVCWPKSATKTDLSTSSKP